MQNGSILFLAVEQSSDIEWLYLYQSRDHQTDIVTWLSTVSKGCLKVYTRRNLLQQIIKLLFLKRTFLSSFKTAPLCFGHF